MKILIFGISNVGKTVTGSLLAQRIGYRFYDLDKEVTQRLSTTLEKFVHTGTLRERDQIRCNIIDSLLELSEDFVLAVTPLSYPVRLEEFLAKKDVLAFQLTDSYENIFDRLVFSDENDVIYKDDDYKNEHKEHYLEEILEDQAWYGEIYSNITTFPMNGLPPNAVVNAIISRFSLLKKDGVS